MTSPGGPEAQYEGIAILNMKGNLRWGYESSRTEPKLDVFFHCAAWISDDEIVVFRDVEYERFDTACSLIRVNLLEPSARVWRAPKKLHANAICDGERVILHSPFSLKETPESNEVRMGARHRDVTSSGVAERRHAAPAAASLRCSQMATRSYRSTKRKTEASPPPSE
jgi:hypothetical protein